jgi:hypothetical protein
MALGRHTNVVMAGPHRFNRLEVRVIVSSAALFFDPCPATVCSSGWLDGILEFGRLCGLHFDLADASGQGLASETAVPWLTISEKVRVGLESGTISRLDLFASLPNYKQIAFGWSGCVSLDFARGVFYIGADARKAPRLADLLQRSYSFVVSFGIKYGFAYSRSPNLGPFLYAVGMIAGLDYSSEDEDEANSIAAWRNEMNDRRRYLRGSFRGVYPASVLSSAHVHEILDDSALREVGTGSLQKLDESCYLWVVESTEVQKMEELLHRKGLLIKWED